MSKEKLKEIEDNFHQYLLKCVDHSGLDPASQLVLISYVHHSINPATNSNILVRRMSPEEAEFLMTFLVSNGITDVKYSRDKKHIPDSYNGHLTEVPDFFEKYTGTSEEDKKFVSDARKKYEEMSISKHKPVIINWRLPETLTKDNASAIITYIMAHRVQIMKLKEKSDAEDCPHDRKEAINLICVYLANKKSEIIFGYLTNDGKKETKTVRDETMKVLKEEGYNPIVSYYIPTKEGGKKIIAESDLSKLPAATLKTVMISISI